MDYIGILWIACMPFAYALSFAYWQNYPKWKSLADNDYAEDLIFSLMISIGGPVSILVFYFAGRGGKCGLKWY